MTTVAAPARFYRAVARVDRAPEMVDMNRHIRPREVAAEWVFDAAWDLLRVTVSGPKILRNGDECLREDSFRFFRHQDMPDWVADFVNAVRPEPLEVPA